MGDRKESVYGEKRGSRKGNRKRRIEWEEKRERRILGSLDIIGGIKK